MTDDRAVRLALRAAHYQTQLEQAQELIRTIAMDYGDHCHKEDR